MAEIEVRGRENGPYLINGAGVWVDAEGNESPIEGKIVALCRCGGSKNKPFCDGTHRRINFQAPAVSVRLSQGHE